MDEITNGIHPLHLSEFKNVDSYTPNTVIYIPEKIENRVSTDICFLIFFIVCVILLMPFFIYTLMGSDIRRIGKVDDCGNVCGDSNIKYEQWQCTGQNFTDKKFLQITNKETKIFGIEIAERGGECVEECRANYMEVGWLCISEDTLELYRSIIDLLIYDALYLSRETVVCKIIFSFLISVGFSVVMVYLFRCSVAVMVWAILLCLFIFCGICTGFVWIMFTFDEGEGFSGIQYVPIVSSIGTLFILIYVAAAYFLRNKIKLVILLLIESTAAICAVPSLVIVPIFTFIASCIIVILFSTTTVYMLAASELIEDEDSPGKLYYGMTLSQMIIIIFNCIITIWVLYFVDGIQYMITAGVISEWYFAKDKANLMQPLKNMTIIVFKYHLGTIAFGSIILLIAHVVHFFLKSILRRVCACPCTICWIKCAKSLLEFATKRTYIMTAMHGQPFYKSGKRAANLIIGNVCNTTAVVFIGVFIFGATIFFIAVFTVLVSACLFLSDLDDYVDGVIIVLPIIFLLAVFVGVTFISLFKTATDTIFMCFCEDSILNDGMSRPYAMSTNLIKFIEKSKKPTVQKSFIRSDPEILDTKM